jgi:uncharacterized membrane protein YecN with MAPEG domain
MTFLIYVIGFVLVTAGVAWALAEAGVATVYIAIACLILLGLGVVTGATRTRHKDPPTT